MELEDALRELLGALVDDASAREVRAVVVDERADVTVTRAGRRERLELTAPALDIEGARTLTLGPLVVNLAMRGPALHLYARRTTPSGDSLRALVEEGALPPGFDTEILAAALAGHGVLAVGPARALRRRVVRALATAAADVAHVLDLDDDSGPLRARAERATTLGAELVVAEVDLEELRRAARAPLDVAWIASVRAPTAESLFAALSPNAPLAVHVCVFGYTPDGTPRLVERYAPGPGAEATRNPPAAPPAPRATSRALEPAEVEAPGPRVVVEPHGQPMPPDPLPPLPALAEAPPDDWGAPDDGPGWELGPTPPSPATGFEKALASVQAPKPKFIPQLPSPHPQARELQTDSEDEDPLGGLSLEPPGEPLGEDEP